MKLKAYDFNQSCFLLNLDHLLEALRYKEKRETILSVLRKFPALLPTSTRILTLYYYWHRISFKFTFDKIGGQRISEAVRFVVTKKANNQPHQRK